MNDKVNLSAKNPEMVEGPYYAIGGTYRSDVRDGLPGAKLELHIQVLNAADGTPLSGIDIDLWHADAIGRYSGFDANPDEVPADLSNGQIPTNDDTFLRGRQTTDGDGNVTFLTIYPSWYALRTPHVHLKLFEGDVCNLTTQIYFPEALNQKLNTEHPGYARKNEQDTFNNRDPVIATTSGDFENTWVDIAEGADGYIGHATVIITPGEVHEPIIPPAGQIPPKGGRPHDVPVK